MVYVQVVIDVSSRFELRSIPIMSGHGYRSWTTEETVLLLHLRSTHPHLSWEDFRHIYGSHVSESRHRSADALSSKHAALSRYSDSPPKIQYPSHLLPQADPQSVYGYFPIRPLMGNYLFSQVTPPAGSQAEQGENLVSSPMSDDGYPATSTMGGGRVHQSRISPSGDELKEDSEDEETLQLRLETLELRLKTLEVRLKLQKLQKRHRNNPNELHI